MTKTEAVINSMLLIAFIYNSWQLDNARLNTQETFRYGFRAVILLLMLGYALLT